MKRELLVDGGFVLALSILIAIGWISYQSFTAMTEADRQEDRSDMVIQGLDRLRSAVTDVETGQRGFIITGEERYLEPYNSALSQVDSGLATLKRLTRDNPRQEERLRDIEAAVREKLAELKLTVDLRRTKGFDAAHEVVVTDKGKAQMDLIRRRIADAQVEEQRVLQQRAGTKEVASRGARRAIVVGRIISFVLLALVFLVLKKEIAQRVRAESELRTYQGGLEHLVKTRTAELEQEVAERRRPRACCEGRTPSWREKTLKSSSFSTRSRTISNPRWSQSRASSVFSTMMPPPDEWIN